MPTNALAEDGVPPEPNDKVSFSVEGTVKSVSGGNATVSIDSINGEPVSEEASESPEEEAAEGPGDQEPASGASPRTGLDMPMAPMGIAGRQNRAGTNLMRNKLLKGARGRPLPF